jgi:putative ABC transport system permease protein
MNGTWRGGLARWIYRGLLAFAPRSTRRYRADMIETFNALSRSADAEGLASTCRLLAREISQMFTAHRRPNVSPFPHTRTPLMWDRFSYIWRSLVRRPVFALTVTTALALGTAVTTTLFAVVETVLLRPLPYPDADRLVTVMESNPNAPGQGTLAAPGRIEDWHRLNQTFVAISASYGDSVTDTSGPEPERLATRKVTPRFFEVYAAPAVAGRTFTAEEELETGPTAAVISDAYWARRFGRDRSAVGRSLVIAGISHPIVGVMARSFSPDAVDVYLPAKTNAFLLGLRDARFVFGVGRLKAGVTIAQARADLDRVQQGLGQTFPATDKGWSAVVRDLKDVRVGDRGTALWLAFGGVGLIWLISISSVAALVLSEAQRRSRELAIRTALGASRRRAAGVIVQEVLVMAVAGGIAGVAIARTLIGLIPALFENLPRLAELALDWRAAAFAVLTSAIAAAICGVLPALQATTGNVAPTLARGGRGSSGVPHRAQRWLVGVQVALGVVLCASAVLLGASYQNLAGVDRGFTTGGLVTFHVAARWDEPREPVGQMQVNLIAALERMPGVSAAGFVNFLPAPGGSLRYQVRIDGLSTDAAGGAASHGSRMVSDGYLRAIGAPLHAGARCAPPRVDFTAPATALVNQAFVDRYAQGQHLVGRQMRMTDRPKNPITIVGIVGNVAEDGSAVAPYPFIYHCASAGGWPDPNYVVRTSDPAGLIGRLRAQVREIDPSRAVFSVRVLDDVLDQSIAEPRLNAGIVSGFAVAALLIGAMGLYALFARLVTESRQEIGVRLALGATPGSIRRLVIGGAGRLLVAGAGAGIALAAGAYTVLKATLFGVGTSDIALAVVVTAGLLALASLGAVIPAFRASRVAPTEALRQ